MRVCLTFYRTVMISLMGLSVICAYQVWQPQSVYFILPVFWVKIITTVIMGTYIAIFRSEQFIFFNNLGYSRGRIFLYCFMLDFSLWLLLMVVVSQML